VYLRDFETSFRVSAIETTSEASKPSASFFYANVFIDCFVVVLVGIKLPQIRCPNCGLTISMENRKEIDVELITNAVRHGKSTFTRILHSTKLPRKTLSLRLKELCEEGALVRKEGGYMLSSTPKTGKWGYLTRISNSSSYKKLGPVVLVAVLLLSSPIAAQVLASYLAYVTPVIQEPIMLGTFTMDLSVHNVNDLYGWQTVIAFDSEILEVVEVSSGGYVGEDLTFFKGPEGGGIVFLGGILLEPVAGKDGSGTLASIVFGYYAEEFEDPSIVPAEGVLTTTLLDSQGEIIPDGLTALALTTQS
jgi:predicted transcriptional regulator